MLRRSWGNKFNDCSSRRQSVDWDALARLDPLWAICSRPDARGGAWDLESFFQTGNDEVTAVLARPEAQPGDFDTALDFGCGIGRVARALANHFKTCYAVDISAEMLARARALNESCQNCVFVKSEGRDLRQFESDSIDFIYSTFVLQHLPSREQALEHIREFARIVRPGGAIVFQLPESLTWRQRIQPRRRLYHALRRAGARESWLYGRLHLHPIRMIAVDRRAVESALRRAGASIVHIEVVDQGNALAGLRYFARPLGA